MENYEKAVKLNDEDFKEIIGVKRPTFYAMVKILKDAMIQGLKSGEVVGKEAFYRGTTYTDTEILSLLHYPKSACI